MFSRMPVKSCLFDVEDSMQQRTELQDREYVEQRKQPGGLALNASYSSSDLPPKAILWLPFSPLN